MDRAWPITAAIFHTLSLLLSLLLCYSHHIQRKPLISRFAATLVLYHLLNLASFVDHGLSLPESIFPLWCVFRKAGNVYSAESVYWFAAAIAGRMWMIVSGREIQRPDARRLDLRLSWLCLLIPLIPALLAALPQLLIPRPPDVDPDLNRCVDGFIRAWQLIPSGVLFTLPTTLVGIFTLAAVIRHLVKLAVTPPDSSYAHAYASVARRAAISTSLRVLLLALGIGIGGGYYSIKDIVRVARGPPEHHLVLPDTLDPLKTADLGRIFVSLWGLLFFLIFGTTTQSLAIMRGEGPNPSAQSSETPRHPPRSSTLRKSVLGKRLTMLGGGVAVVIPSPLSSPTSSYISSAESSIIPEPFDPTLYSATRSPSDASASTWTRHSTSHNTLISPPSPPAHHPPTWTFMNLWRRPPPGPAPRRNTRPAYLTPVEEGTIEEESPAPSLHRDADLPLDYRSDPSSSHGHDDDPDIWERDDSRARRRTLSRPPLHLV